MSESVYTVLVEDRHTDPEIKVFANYKKAKAYAAERLEFYGGEDTLRRRGSKDRGLESWDLGENDRLTLERKDLL